MKSGTRDGLLLRGACPCPAACRAAPSTRRGAAFCASGKPERAQIEKSRRTAVLRKNAPEKLCRNATAPALPIGRAGAVFIYQTARRGAAIMNMGVVCKTLCETACGWLGGQQRTGEMTAGFLQHPLMLHKSAGQRTQPTGYKNGS